MQFPKNGFVLFDLSRFVNVCVTVNGYLSADFYNPSRHIHQKVQTFNKNQIFPLSSMYITPQHQDCHLRSKGSTVGFRSSAHIKRFRRPLLQARLAAEE